MSPMPIPGLQEPLGAPIGEDPIPEAAPPPEPPPDPNLIELTQGQIYDLIEKVRLARQDEQELSSVRKSLLDAYMRMPFGNEQEGRSNYVAADVYTQVEQSFPAILRSALSSSQKIKYLGPDQKIADALRVRMSQILTELGAHRIYTTIIKDGLITIFGAAKLWWVRKYEPVQREEMLDDEGLQTMRMAAQDGTVSDLQIEPLEPRTAMYEPPDAPPMVIEGKPMFKVRAMVPEVKESGPMLAPVPPEELLIERGKAEMNDKKGIGLERQVTVGELLRMQNQYSMPGQPFFRNLQQAIDEAGGDEEQTSRAERENREAIHYSASSPYETYAPATKMGAKKKLVEWCGYVEDSRGREVFAKTWILGRTCIRCAVAEEDIVPYVGWSPTTLPHTIRGLSVAQAHLHEMRMRSTLARALMDQIGFAIDREVFVASRSTDILGLQRRYPGKVIVGMPGQDFVFGEMPDVKPQIYQAMTWITEEEQSIGPSNPLIWGGSPDPREKTATGAKIRTNTSMWRLDTVTMNFVEQCLVDMHRKLIALHQKHMDIPITVTVDGEQITLTREVIQGPYTCVADFQLELDYDDSRFLKAKALADNAILVAQKYPMLYPLGKLHHAQKEMILASGERDPTLWIEPPPPQMEGWFPGMGAGLQMAQGGGMGAGPQQMGIPAQRQLPPGVAPNAAALEAPPDQALEPGGTAQPMMTRKAGTES